MSISGEFDKVTLFGKHHAQGVIDTLEVPANDLAACQAVRFIFKVMADECRNPKISQTENSRFASDLTIDKVSKRYLNYRLYKDHFFPKDYIVDHDALVTAVILDEYIVHANEPIQDPDDPEEIIIRNDGFDEGILFRASVIHDGASNNDFRDEETGNISYETAFLIHINILQSLEEISENFGDFNHDDLSKIYKEDLQEFKPLILTWNLFGTGVKEYIGRLESQILSILSRPAPKTPHLSLVPPLQ